MLYSYCFTLAVTHCRVLSNLEHSLHYTVAHNRSLKLIIINYNIVLTCFVLHIIVCNLEFYVYTKSNGEGLMVVLVSQWGRCCSLNISCIRISHNFLIVDDGAETPLK